LIEGKGGTEQGKTGKTGENVPTGTVSPGSKKKKRQVREIGAYHEEKKALY